MSSLWNLVANYTDLIAASHDSKICKEMIVKGSVIMIPGKIIIAKGSNVSEL